MSGETYTGSRAGEITASVAAWERDRRSIYCDGSDFDLDYRRAERLCAAGVLIPHPDRGLDGIGREDFTLAPGATWEDVYRSSPFHGGTWPPP